MWIFKNQPQLSNSKSHLISFIIFIDDSFLRNDKSVISLLFQLYPFYMLFTLPYCFAFVIFKMLFHLYMEKIMSATAKFKTKFSKLNYNLNYLLTSENIIYYCTSFHFIWWIIILLAEMCSKSLKNYLAIRWAVFSISVYHTKLMYRLFICAT